MATLPPRRPPPGPGHRGMSEFAGVLGDVQRPGSGQGIMALPTVGGAVLPGESSVPMQVQSVYDTRLVGAFDFATSFTTLDQIDPGNRENSFEVPAGYTLVVRRVEFDIFPTYNGTTANASLSIQLTYDSQPIPLNNVELFGVYDAYGWNTHHVCEQGHLFGVRWVNTDVLRYDIGWRFFGNLIPTTGRPPREEVGSLPLMVKGA